MNANRIIIRNMKKEVKMSDELVKISGGVFSYTSKKI